MSGFGARQVEADDRQTELVAGLHHRAHQRQRRHPVHLFGRVVVEGLDQVLEIGREAAGEHAHGAGDDAVAEGRDSAGADGFGGLVLAAGTIETAVDRGDDLGNAKAWTDVELGREPHLHVEHPFGQAIVGQLVGHPFQGFFVAQHRTGVGEAVQIVRQIAVALLEDQLEQALGSIGRQLDVALLGELDQRRQAQRSV